MKKLSKKTIAILFVCLLTTLSAVITYAVYVNQSYKKGIIVTGPSEALFSSDILKQYRYASAVSARAERTFTVNLCDALRDNYPLSQSFTVTNSGKQNGRLVNSEDIIYDLSINVEMRDGSPLDASLLPIVECNGNVYEMNSASLVIENNTLYGKTLCTDIYNIIFKVASIDRIIVKIGAVPHDRYAEAAMQMLLYRELFPINNDIEAVFDFYCVGVFDDNTGVSNNPSTDYHAFNYTVNVRNGMGSVTLTWNTDYLKLDKSFADAHGVEQDAGSVTFTVDSNEADEYSMVFYRVLPIENESWDAVEDLVSIEVTNSND